MSRPTYINKIERSDEVIARLLNADQRHTLRVLLNADGMSLWLDYLSISFKMRTAEWLVKTLLQSGYDLFIQRDGGRFGYSITYAFAGQAFITVYGKKRRARKFDHSIRARHTYFGKYAHATR
ncbi:hypothetical protein [Leuconostoc mesenteroides]|uniref:hypothetical protein n=1 Tax=Leuconostoc mesenteroides TaxID=1245 RepID=UPI001FA85AB8|nr:hypothetical protein [Leuconostoc mesenteroides]